MKSPRHACLHLGLRNLIPDGDIERSCGCSSLSQYIYCSRCSSRSTGRDRACLGEQNVPTVVKYHAHVRCAPADNRRGGEPQRKVVFRPGREVATQLSQRTSNTHQKFVPQLTSGTSATRAYPGPPSQPSGQDAPITPTLSQPHRHPSVSCPSGARSYIT